ncbi:hypothetical protein BDV59DRAFT_209021 [Aspergillus ambiguus]|uniref:uncharacterized protein n=1 Tax=Aspergillus ambiguus TaxID=176160 RepID=UPI003CCD81E0
MVRSYFLVGFLAALGHLAHGLIFNDRIRQDVGGELLYLLHDSEDATTVRLGSSDDLEKQGWTSNTEGFNDDEAVITPLNSNKTLQCEVGSKCTLDPEGFRMPYRITRVDEKDPIFTIQDIPSSLYLSRTSDLYLELSEIQDDSIYFIFEKIQRTETLLWS